MTDCAKCGDCCENIYFRLTPGDITARLADPYYRGENRKDLTFMSEHWKMISPDLPGARYSCDMFDSETRQCTAHSSRPPVCRDYPWYGKAPEAKPLKVRCSFRADLPIFSGGLLPIVEVS